MHSPPQIGSIGDAKKELEDVEKDAQTLMSDDAEIEPAASGPEGARASSSVDEQGTGMDAVTPQAATTAVGEAMSGSGGDAAPDASSEVVEDTENHERRSG